MHLKGLDLNLLVVLDALLLEKSVTRAGERLYLSQSAVSGALSRLRDYFGDQLLVPSGSKMVLTKFAERLEKSVRGLITDAELLISSNAEFNPATSTRSFLLNMSDVSATMIVVKSLSHVRQLAPAVHIEIVTLHERIQELIEQGEIDFIVVPDFMASPLHPFDVLFEDTTVCIAWSGNQHLKKGLNLEQFLSLGHVTMRMLRRKEHIGELILQNTGLRPRFELILPTFGLVPLAVIGTDRLAMVNKGMAEYYARYMPLKIFPLPLDLPKTRAVLQWNRHNDNDPGTQWLRHTLVQTVRAETL
jgi:LysR family transcriptional regulator, nod-box dependent transcriptional activator